MMDELNIKAILKAGESQTVEHKGGHGEEQRVATYGRDGVAVALTDSDGNEDVDFQGVTDIPVNNHRGVDRKGNDQCE